MRHGKWALSLAVLVAGCVLLSDSAPAEASGGGKGKAGQFAGKGKGAFGKGKGDSKDGKGKGDSKDGKGKGDSKDGKGKDGK